jgi:hypothetical protein
MTPFSIFILVYFFCGFIFAKDMKDWFGYQLILFVFISVFIEVGFFLDVESLRVEYWQITSILTFISSLFVFFNKPFFNKKFILYVSVALTCLLLLIFYPVHELIVIGPNGINEEVISGEASYREPVFSKFSLFYLGFLLIQAFCVQVIYISYDRNNYFNLIYKLSFCVKFVLLLVLLELMMKMAHDDLFGEIIIQIFGEGTSQSISRIIKDKHMLQGLTREGSHLAYALYTGIIVLFADFIISNRNIWNIIFIFIAVVELCISMAFTSLLVFVMLFLMYLVYNYNVKYSLGGRPKILRSILQFCLISGVLYTTYFLLDDYYFDRFYTSFEDFMTFMHYGKNDAFSKMSELSSTAARVYSVVDNISLLQYRPFFGVGIGTNISHGSTALLLGEMGLLGLFAYIYFYFYYNSVQNGISYGLFVFIWIVGNIIISKPALFVRIDGFLMFVCFNIILGRGNLINKTMKLC